VTEILLDYERPGKSRLTYREELLQDLPDVKILSMKFTGKSEMVVGETTILQPGSPMVWFIFPGKWYDIGRFYLIDGAFTGYYTNLCTPVQMQGNRWATTDLFLDLWIPARGGSSKWLDEDELDHAVRTDALPRHLFEKAIQVRSEIEDLCSRDLWPPTSVTDWTM